MLRVIDDAGHDDEGRVVPRAPLDGLRTLMGSGADAHYELLTVRSAHVENECCDEGGRLEYSRLADTRRSRRRMTTVLRALRNDAMCSYRSAPATW